MIASSPRLKNAARGALIRVMDYVPLSIARQIRDGYAGAPNGSVRQSIFRRAIFLLKYKNLSKAMDVLDVPGDPSFRLSVCHSVLVNRLFFLGVEGYEGAEPRVWKELCQRATRILEIGANIGFYTVQGARAAPGASYIAVEPHPGNFALLKRNLALNSITHVSAIAAAVVGTKHADRMTLSVPDADLSGAPLGSFLSSGGEISRDSSTSYEVDVVEAGELVKGVDLIKLDVEGYEYLILSSIEEYLTANKPTLLVEVLDGAVQLRQLLHKLCVHHGYVPHCFLASGLVEVAPAEILDFQPNGRYLNRDVVLVAERLERDRTPK